MPDKYSTSNETLAQIEEKYEKILSQNPKSNDFSILANALYGQGKIDKAIGVLVRGLGYNKDNVTGRFLLGKIYYERWMIDQARKEMEKVLDSAPDNLEAAILLSQIYRSEDKLDKALEILTAAYTFHNNDNSTLMKIEEIKAEISNLEHIKTLQSFETPVERRKIEEIKFENSNEKDEIYTENMANLYIEQGQYDKAREILEKIFTNEPQRNSAIEKLEKVKLNKMNMSAGFNSKD